MHIKNRLISVAAVVAMAAALFFGSTMEMRTAGEEDTEGSHLWFEKTDTIYFWYTDDAMTNFINSAAVAFGERENVRVIPVLTEDSEYLEALNQASLHSGQVPDAYIISNDSLEKAYLAGLAEEIGDEGAVCNETNFPAAALSAVAYQGKTVAYPLSYETSALVYNETYLAEWAVQIAQKDLLNAGEDLASAENDSGIPVDEAALAALAEEYFQKAIPHTVNDILNIANTFDVPAGVDGVLKWDVSDIFYNYWIVGNYMIVGGDAGDDKRQININNPETIQCLEVYKALNQFFFIESDTVSYDSVLQDFIDGKTVFSIVTTDAAARLAEAKESGELAFEYGIAMMPDISEELKSRSMSVTNGVAVNGYSEHKELANRFAAYLVTECADSLYERSGKVSANRNAGTENGALQIFMLEYGESVPLPKMMETGNFWLQLERLFSSVWNGADVTTLVEELANQIVTQVEAVY
ncbi:MAG: extracellular solute-binding protein [Lachnospiraceae bacterium]|jgi:Maltose-binding periplasmic proteins/domains|nr:extracellular solute-binding protein [Lachnospiraceae bacterium]MCI9675654.1 extracellular solute-binding protein [Lachnospiraceae bacterium]